MTALNDLGLHETKYVQALEDALNAYDAALLCASLFGDKSVGDVYKALREQHKEARSQAIEAARGRLSDGKTKA